jgi:hypothetical protein
MRKNVLGSLLQSIFATVMLLAAVQNVSADEECCTPAITAKIAAATGYVDIVGIKLGMPAQQALDLMKADNPAFNTRMDKRDIDMQYATTRVRSPVPKKQQWVFAIQSATSPDAAGGAESIEADLTLPPTTQVVDYLSRAVTFPKNATPTVDNIIAGLKQKYGAPTWFQPIGSPQLKWLFDSQGQLLTLAQMNKIGFNCDAVTATPTIDPPATGYRGKQSVTEARCEKAGVTVVKAEISPTTTGGSMAGSLTVSMTSIPLLYNGVNTTNVALDELLRKSEEKQRQETNKVATPKL